MANINPVVNSLIFSGSVAGQTSIQAQGVAGNLTILLPNIPPIQGQLLTASSINGNNVFLGWSSAQSSNIPLSALAQDSATTGQFISWNGSSWAPASTAPGEGTVTSFSAGTLAPLFTTSVATATTTPALSFILTNAAQNAVFAGPSVGGAGAPSYRALVAADIPALPYLPSSTVLPVNTSAVASEWLNSYNSTTGAFTQTQPAFSDLSGSLSISQINSKEGVGSKVQTTSQGTTVAGDIVTYADTAGTIADSGTLLSSLASQSQLPQTFTPITSGSPAEPVEFLTGYNAGTGTFSAATPQYPVTSVFGRTGIIVATSGDYSAYYDTLGAAAAILASPAFSGTPTAPTASPLTNSTRIATTAYADAAVAVETARAEAAEAFIPKLYDQYGDLVGAGGSPPSSDNHIASGTSAFPGTVSNTVAITLSGNAAFSDGSHYVVQITLTDDSGHSFLPYTIWVSAQTATSFVVNCDSSVTSGFAWTAIGF